jgi:hypothetical protein
VFRPILRALFPLVLLASPVALVAQAPGPITDRTAEEAEIRVAIDKYLRSHATGNGAHVDSVFHPVLQMLWVNADTLARRTAAEYVAGFRGTPPADEARRRRWIASVEVWGNAAAARVVLDYPTVTYIDFFTLLKIGGEWKIVSKVFAAEPKG